MSLTGQDQVTKLTKEATKQLAKRLSITGQNEAFVDMQTKIQDQVTKIQKDTSALKKRKEKLPSHFWDDVAENHGSGKTGTYRYIYDKSGVNLLKFIAVCQACC